MLMHVLLFSHKVPAAFAGLMYLFVRQKYFVGYLGERTQRWVLGTIAEPGVLPAFPVGDGVGVCDNSKQCPDCLLRLCRISLGRRGGLKIQLGTWLVFPCINSLA
jgi:hypothetical protein